MKTDVFLAAWRFAFLPALCGFFLIPASAFAQHTYYISKATGSDSNTATQAQSKSTPWAHLPGMPSCTSNCASYRPQGGVGPRRELAMGWNEQCPDLHRRGPNMVRGICLDTAEIRLPEIILQLQSIRKYHLDCRRLRNL